MFISDIKYNQLDNQLKNETEEMIMTRKILCLVLAICMFGSVSVSAEESMQTGYWNIAYPYRYLTFATDGGSFIKTLELPTGEYVSLDEFIPKKDGYIFDGWYNDPRTKVDRVYAVTLNENITVYAKWIDDGTPKTIPEKPIGATNEEIPLEQYESMKN